MIDIYIIDKLANVTTERTLRQKARAWVSFFSETNFHQELRPARLLSVTV